jgi:hypothetical protein
MNKKFKTLEWWTISIWFLLFGIVSALILFTPPIPPINYTVMIAGFSMMIYCTMKEDAWFPDEDDQE